MFIYSDSAATGMVSSFEVEAMIRGYHWYKEIWDAALGEELQCQREPDNPHDIFAMAVLNEVWNRSRSRSKKSLFIFLRRGGVIHCTITGIQRYSTDLNQGGGHAF